MLERCRMVERGGGRPRRFVRCRPIFVSAGNARAARDRPPCGAGDSGSGDSGTLTALLLPGTAIAFVRTYRSRQYAHLMLDVLIERVSYDPMAIFIAVAIVLLIMLARTL